MIDIVAEIGSTWYRATPEQSKAAALTSIEQAAKAGATAVKFQLGLANLFSPERVPKQWQATQLLNVPPEWWTDLRVVADACRVQLWASVFDPLLFRRADMVKFLGIKLASGELTPNSEQLIRTAAAFCTEYLRPLILSTGTHTDADIRWALDLLRSYRLDVTLLNCVSKYPAQVVDYRLDSLLKYRGVVTLGLSDHTMNDELVTRAVELGYLVFEKHFRLEDCPEKNPDYVHSLTPDKFAGYVQAIRDAEAWWLAEVPKEVHPDEANEILWMQRGRDGRRPREEAV